MSSERPKVKYIKYVIDQTMRYRNDKICWFRHWLELLP